MGKTTLGNILLSNHLDLSLSVSHTTRSPRGQEVDGAHYHFVDEATFQFMAERGDFAEHAGVFGKRYGTTHATIEQLQSSGRHDLFDIDYQGVEQLLETYPDAVTVLVTPPSMATLEARLRARNTDTPEQIQTRLAKAHLELSQYRTFRYVIVNESLDDAGAVLSAIFRAELSKVSRNRDFLASLLGETKPGSNNPGQE